MRYKKYDKKGDIITCCKSCKKLIPLHVTLFRYKNMNLSNLNVMFPWNFYRIDVKVKTIKLRKYLIFSISLFIWLRLDKHLYVRTITILMWNLYKCKKCTKLKLNYRFSEIEMLESIKMHFWIIKMIYFVHYEWYSEKSNVFWRFSLKWISFLMDNQYKKLWLF